MISLIRIIALIIAVLLVLPSLALASVTPSKALTPAMSNWETIEHDFLGSNYNPQTQITKDNVNRLELKWTHVYPPATDFGEMWPSGEGTGGPALVVDGVVYVISNQRFITALDAATGEPLWREITTYDVRELAANFPHVIPSPAHTHGVFYYRDQGDVLIPPIVNCRIDAIDSKTGALKWTLDELCGTEEEAKSWGSQGFYQDRGNHPPQFVPGTQIMVVPTMGATGRGGRSFVAGYDMRDPDTCGIAKNCLIWKTFLMPPKEGDPEWALRECDKGWFFVYPEFLESDGEKLATRCTDVERGVLLDDWQNKVPGTPRFGAVHTASTISAVWGNYPIDPDTGIVYISTGDISPHHNATYRYGPNLYGASVIALNGTSGEIVWWFATNPHEFWDWDCSWAGILGKAGNRDVLFKACKNGIMYALDRATGEPVWIFDSPNIWRTAGTNYGVDKFGNPRSFEACCRLIEEHMGKPWANYPSVEPFVSNPPGNGGIEMDPAYDPSREMIYVVASNQPKIRSILPVRDFGNQIRTQAPISPTNSTVYGINATTGEVVWEFFIDEAPFRGGVIVSGGVLYVPASDGNLYLLDADNGNLLRALSFGNQLQTQPSMGATADGEMLLLVQQGGRRLVRAGQAAGGLLAFGLSDNQEAEEFEVPPELIIADNGSLRTIYVGGGIIGVVAVVVISFLYIRRRR